MATMIGEPRKTKIINENGAGRIPIYQNHRNITNLKLNTECYVAPVDTKHGIAYIVWSDDQPQIEDKLEHIGEQL